MQPVLQKMFRLKYIYITALKHTSLKRLDTLFIKKTKKKTSLNSRGAAKQEAHLLF